MLSLALAGTAMASSGNSSAEGSCPLTAENRAELRAELAETRLDLQNETDRDILREELRTVRENYLSSKGFTVECTPQFSLEREQKQQRSQAGERKGAQEVRQVMQQNWQK